MWACGVLVRPLSIRPGAIEEGKCYAPTMGDDAPRRIAAPVAWANATRPDTMIIIDRSARCVQWSQCRSLQAVRAEVQPLYHVPRATARSSLTRYSRTAMRSRRVA